jgi:hypothetical protein
MSRLFADRAQAERYQLRAASQSPPAEVNLRQVRLTIEARKRYFERFWGPLPQIQDGRRDSEEDVLAASRELRERMLATGRVCESAPRWVGMRTQAGRRARRCACYVVIDEEIALPLVWDRAHPDRLIAVTCLWVPTDAAAGGT